MKYKVTVTTLWHNGKKYQRGDIIDTDYGTKTDLAYDEPKPEEKPKRTRKPKIVEVVPSED